MSVKAASRAPILVVFSLLLLLPAAAYAAGPVNPGSFSKHAGNPVVPAGAAGSWDASTAMAPSVVFVGGQYHMWFVGAAAPTFVGRVGHATSPDGLTWSKDSAPALDVGSPGEWDSKSILGVSVLFDGGFYRMWYAADNGSTVQIGYATSDDGLTWVKLADPVLSPDGSSWEQARISWPCVIKVGGRYHMWYRGGNIPNTAIGYATSTDGVNWVKHSGNPVFTGGDVGDWDDVLEAAAVTHDGFLYHMWYSGAGANDVGQVGHAFSADGVNWTRTGIVLANGAAGAFDALGADYAFVRLEDSTYKMWYSGLSEEAYQIGYAEGAGVASHWLYVPVVLRNYGP
jgi:predicted GH43/DUF377 family glycosyl hydrolase